jgi:hypothetical protein
MFKVLELTFCLSSNEHSLLGIARCNSCGAHPRNQPRACIAVSLAQVQFAMVQEAYRKVPVATSATAYSAQLLQWPQSVHMDRQGACTSHTSRYKCFRDSVAMQRVDSLAPPVPLTWTAALPRNALEEYALLVVRLDALP